MKKGRMYALLAILMVSAFAAVPTAVTASESDGTFSYGVGSLLVDLDPQQAWDSASIDVIDQVCEGLFGYNLSDPELAIIPVLAADLGTWNDEATQFTVNLKSGVKFHDDTDFTAADVIYTFDRLNSLILAGESQIAELYAPLNATYASHGHEEDGLVIKNVTQGTSDLQVIFNLNYPYVPFVPLLCFSGSVILPNDEYPTDSLMDVASGDILVGTGPYSYVSQTDTQTTLEKFTDWHGTFPDRSFDTIYWILYQDDDAKQNAFLSGQIDWLDGAAPDYMDQYEADPDIYVGEQRQGTVIGYMGMNNQIIPKAMRQAISYAFNYEYEIAEIRQGNAARLTSPVPEGIMYHNPDLDYPTYNVTQAREILETHFELEVGDVLDGRPAYTNTSDDAWWEGLTYSQPLATYNYTWNSGNSVRQDLGILLQANLYEIGIQLELRPMTWAEYLTRLLGDFEKLEIYMIGWGPDYNDPSNYINPLFSNTSSSNGAQVNDPYLQQQMALGLTTTDPDDRRDVYYEIQRYVVEDLMPWIFLDVGLGRGVWHTNVAGIQRNPMGKIYFGSMHWTTPTTSDDGNPGIPGYGLLSLVGAAAFAMAAIVYKKRH